MRRLLVIVPLFITPADEESIKNDLSRYAWQGTTVDVIGHKGNIAVNSRAEADLAAPEFLKLARNAEKSGYDAVISYCYADVGVEAAKEKLKINVVGPLETSAIMANILGTKFSAITIETATAYMKPTLKLLALDSNLISTRGISLDQYFVFSANKKQTQITQNSLKEQCKEALRDGANVLILACTGFPQVEELKSEISVPIVESDVTVKVAEILTDLRLWQSSRPHSGNEIREKSAIKPKLRIKNIVPTSSDSLMKGIQGLQSFVEKTTKISNVQNNAGPTSIRSIWDISSVAPFVVREASTAKDEGFDAAVVVSPFDPALASAREVCDIPVIGAGETAMMIGCEYGSISIFTEDEKAVPLMWRIVRKLGIRERIVSVRNVVKGHEAKDTDLLQVIEAESRKGAKAIVVETRNSKRYFDESLSMSKLPIIDLYPCALRIAEAVCTLSLAHSKIAYPTPKLPKYHSDRLKKLKNAPRGNMFLYKTD